MSTTLPIPLRIDWRATIFFAAMHAAAVGGVLTLGWSQSGMLLAGALYYLRMFGITAGFHRYFAHRTYKTGRLMQFLLAWLATMSAQQGVLWWAGHHRVHHKHSDKPCDIHSPKPRGVLWAHVGWFLVTAYNETPIAEIKDFAKYPELRLLNRYFAIPPLLLAVLLLLAGGPWGLVWGFFVSTVLLWHGTFTLNSLAHWLGRRRYATHDDSRNNLAVALLTLGEGWHNNHHYYPRAANQGFYWWEIDPTYYLLRALSALGLVWDLKGIPARLRDRAEPRSSAV